MKKEAWFVFALAGIVLGIVFSSSLPNKILSPLVEKEVKKVTTGKFDKYSFPSLSARTYTQSEIALEKIIKKEDQYTSWLFSYLSDGKRVTGMANLPHKGNNLPIVIMLRGYADKEIYFTGLGTRKAAGALAENGFVTLAPDFLGFGGSETESADILEARFTRPITILNLLASIKTLPQANPEKIFFWGHSNGGQIALSVLEISGQNYPTALWAPMTKPFPKSILQYVDEADPSPESRKVARAIEEFKKNHDPNNFNIANFFDQINAPIQLHQGGADPWVLPEWQKEFINKAKGLGKEVNYHYYPASDHNLKQDWDKVMERDIEFFRRYLN